MKKQAKSGQGQKKQAAPTGTDFKSLPMRLPQAGEPPVKDRPFPIVGIGASAGGLEALETFLRNVPEKSGMAFVVVQHLDPTHKGVMVELLQRASTMPVVQVRDRMKVKPDCVYVIPPNRDMSILHGAQPPRGRRHAGPQGHEGKGRGGLRPVALLGKVRRHAEERH